MSNAITKYTSDAGLEITLTPQIVREQIVQGDSTVSEQEVSYFINLCQAQGLNPFIKDAYLIKYGSHPASTITSKDAFMKRAESQEDYQGFQAGVSVINQEGKLERREGSLTLENEKLIGGWAKVYRSNREHPIFVEVSFVEYNTGKASWAKMPGTMIRKVAVSQAFREAYPQQLKGLYTSEEMGQAFTPPVEVKNEAQTSAKPTTYKHDYSKISELKQEILKLNDQSEDKVNKAFMAYANGKMPQHMTPDEFSKYEASVIEFAKSILKQDSKAVEAEVIEYSDEEINF